MACKLNREELCDILKPIWNEMGALRINSIAFLHAKHRSLHWFDVYVGPGKNARLAAAIPTEFYPGQRDGCAIYVHESVEFGTFSEFVDSLPLNLSISTRFYNLGQHQKDMIDRYCSETGRGSYKPTSYCKTFQCPTQIEQNEKQAYFGKAGMQPLNSE